MAQLRSMKTLEDYFGVFRSNTIGRGRRFRFPYGEKELVYADWTATGRAYEPIERYLQQEILPFFANTHTESTTTGALMNQAYTEAKTTIKRHVNASGDDVLIFCGSGMTSAVNKLQRILGLRIFERTMDYTVDGLSPEIDEALRPVVFVTSMEHHSNHVSWLETIATVEIIGQTIEGNVDLDDLQRLLVEYRSRKHKIAAVTACSNVTGIVTPYHEISTMIHAEGGLCFVDFAAAAPYVSMNMRPDEDTARLDAIYFSMHKFLGGPGTPGVLIFNRKLYNNTVPDHPGGGTVSYTNPWKEREYVCDIESREDGGTPPVLQAIKAGMCIKLKDEMGVDNILAREEELLEIAFSRFSKMTNVIVLQSDARQRLGIISFIVNGAHYNLIVKLLNDRFGIQVRGGCSCAGTYGHYLLNVDKGWSHRVWDSIRAGDMSSKPGWVRLSLHPTMTNCELRFIMDAIEQTALRFREWGKGYSLDRASNEYIYMNVQERKKTSKVA